MLVCLVVCWLTYSSFILANSSSMLYFNIIKTKSSDILYHILVFLLDTFPGNKFEFAMSLKVGNFVSFIVVHNFTFNIDSLFSLILYDLKQFGTRGNYLVDIAQLGSGCNQEQQLWLRAAAAQIGFSLLGISFARKKLYFLLKFLNVGSTTNLPCSFLLVLLPDRIILTDNSQKKKTGMVSNSPMATKLRQNN